MDEFKRGRKTVVGVLIPRPTWFFLTLGFRKCVKAAVGNDHFEQGVSSWNWCLRRIHREGLRRPLEENEVAGRLAEGRSQCRELDTE